MDMDEWGVKVHWALKFLNKLMHDFILSILIGDNNTICVIISFYTPNT